MCVPTMRQSIFFLLIHVFTCSARQASDGVKPCHKERQVEFHRKGDTEVIKHRRKESHTDFTVVKFCTIFKVITEGFLVGDNLLPENGEELLSLCSK